MLLTEYKLRQIIRRILLKEQEDHSKNFPKTHDSLVQRINDVKFSDSEKNNPILKDNILKKWKELEAAIEAKDYKAAQSLIDKDGYGDEWDALKDDPLTSGKWTMVKRSIRYMVNNKIKPGGGEGDKKKKNSDSQIKTVQQLLNSIIDQQKIDGDYQGKKLDADGQWGARTRSATSKALSLFTQSKLKDKYGFKGITDAGLNTKKSGGAGSWKKTLSKLVKGVTPEGNGSDNFGKGKYGTLIYVLIKLNEYKQGGDVKPNPKPGDGDKKIEKKKSKYYIENIYKELDKVLQQEKAERVNLGKISLGAFNKMRTGSTIDKSLFLSTPKTYKKPPSLISWLAYTWKDNQHKRDDVNIYFEEYATNSNIIFADGTSGCPKDAVQMYKIAIDGIGNQNAIIKGYVAVKDKEKIYLMSIEQAQKEGHIKSNKK